MIRIIILALSLLVTNLAIAGGVGDSWDGDTTPAGDPNYGIGTGGFGGAGAGDSWGGGQSNGEVCKYSLDFTLGATTSASSICAYWNSHGLNNGWAGQYRYDATKGQFGACVADNYPQGWAIRRECENQQCKADEYYDFASKSCKQKTCTAPYIYDPVQDKCLNNDPPKTCPTGQHLEGDTCVSDNKTCPEGTILKDGMCVVDTTPADPNKPECTCCEDLKKIMNVLVNITTEINSNTKNINNTLNTTNQKIDNVNNTINTTNQKIDNSTNQLSLKLGDINASLGELNIKLGELNVKVGDISIKIGNGEGMGDVDLSNIESKLDAILNALKDGKFDETKILKALDEIDDEIELTNKKLDEKLDKVNQQLEAIKKCQGEGAEVNKKLCDWIDWIKKDLPRNDDNTVSVQDDKTPIELKKDRVKFGSQCPSAEVVPISYKVDSTDVVISYEGLCRGLSDLKPFIIGLAGFASVLIIAGVGRKNG